MKFLMFTKESCGPCGLVKKYINTLNDERSKIIEEIFLEDFSDIPISQENLDLAKRYGVTATPVLVITDSEGIELEKKIGGLNITQSIIKLYDKYDIT